MSFFGATGTGGISGDISPGFQSQRRFFLIRYFVEANVMYILQDPLLVLHVPTSCQPAVQLVTSLHASAEVGLGSDSNSQSPGQKTIVPATRLMPWILINFYQQIQMGVLVVAI